MKAAIGLCRFPPRRPPPRWLTTLPVLAALLPAGCGGADVPGSGSCQAHAVADLPLLDRPGIPTVVGHLHGQPVALMLDTGAANSMVLPSAVDRFGLTADPDNVIGLSGIGGTARTSTATIHGLELGHGRAHDLDLPIGAELGRPGQDPPMLGLFGADFLSNYDVDFDLPRHHFGIYELSGCGDDMQPVVTPYFAVPFQLEDTHITLTIELNGVPVQAILDSGAGSTLVTEADAARAGVTPEALAADRVVHPRGVDGFPVTGHLHRFDGIRLGAERLRNVRVAVAPSDLGITLLGDDFFRLNRIWISYPRRMLFIRPAFDNPMVHMAAAEARPGP